METEYDRTIDDHRNGDHDAPFGVEETSVTPEAEAGPDNRDNPGHEAPLRLGPDLNLDERLTSAAAPFLYLLSTVLIAVAGYFVYLFFHG